MTQAWTSWVGLWLARLEMEIPRRFLNGVDQSFKLLFLVKSNGILYRVSFVDRLSVPRFSLLTPPSSWLRPIQDLGDEAKQVTC